MKALVLTLSAAGRAETARGRKFAQTGLLKYPPV
jgi:hypothetical protein